MPASREAVVNRPLSGEELKKLILADAQRLVDNEGMLSPHIAFGRVGYTLSLKIHVDNPYIPDTLIEATSKPFPADRIAAFTDASGELQPERSELAAIESAPLKDASPDAELAQVDLTRQVTSPNAERIREGLPVPVIVKDHDSTTRTEEIVYPKDAFPDLPPGEVMLKDMTENLKAQWAPVEPSQIEAKQE